MPVVRNQTFVHIMDWLKLASSENGVNSTVFPLVKDVVMAGITDIWSAIRNTCVAKLSKFLEIFTLSQVEELYNSLIKVLLSSKGSLYLNSVIYLGFNNYSNCKIVDSQTVITLLSSFFYLYNYSKLLIKHFKTMTQHLSLEEMLQILKYPSSAQIYKFVTTCIFQADDKEMLIVLLF